MDRQLAVGGEVFFREATYVSDVYDENRYGGLLHVRKPINPFTSVRGEYRLENISIEDMDDDASDILKREEGDYLRSAISASITNDTRDNLFLTRRGHRIQLSGFGTGGFLGGDVDVYGLNLEAVKYFQLPYDMIFHVVGEVATVDTWGDGDRVPIFDRLFLGGANSLRGFDYREVGPKDEDGEPIGGGSLARLTAELTFPVVQRVRGVVFYDVGFVNSGSFDWSPDDINANVGVGVRLDLPTIGPVRLDFGIPVQSDEFNDSNGKFNFNIGYNF
jgi:outer membrane protein insertion porin family